eukprot:5677911-Alexandrium_andersonii.AAC.1
MGLLVSPCLRCYAARVASSGGTGGPRSAPDVAPSAALAMRYPTGVAVGAAGTVLGTGRRAQTGRHCARDARPSPTAARAIGS